MGRGQRLCSLPTAGSPPAERSQQGPPCASLLTVSLQWLGRKPAAQWAGGRDRGPEMLHAVSCRGAAAGQQAAGWSPHSRCQQAPALPALLQAASLWAWWRARRRPSTLRSRQPWRWAAAAQPAAQPLPAQALHVFARRKPPARAALQSHTTQSSHTAQRSQRRRMHAYPCAALVQCCAARKLVAAAPASCRTLPLSALTLTPGALGLLAFLHCQHVLRSTWTAEGMPENKGRHAGQPCVSSACAEARRPHWPSLLRCRAGTFGRSYPTPQERARRCPLQLGLTALP